MTLRTLRLGRRGDLLHPRSGERVPVHRMRSVLARTVPVTPEITDIVLFVHGWNTSVRRARQTANALFTDAETLLARQPHRYPRLPPATDSRLYLVLCWPARSAPLLHGYRRIRDRAHSLTTEGYAAHVIAALLGYLNEERAVPAGATAGTAGGQYLTCVGHSFGGRLLCQAVQESALEGTGTAGPVHVDPRYPYSVDNLLVFQMAARPDSFSPSGVFHRLLTAAPISGPVTLTRSRRDRATGVWHRLAERTGGIGTVGLRGADPPPAELCLRKPDEAYDDADLAHRLVEVDASRCYVGSPWNLISGAHSDIRHPESAHLLLSLMNFSR
ncbi:alpha/beta hydrolase [Streptomyces beigongshangae]|uniref:alpha/beta hydrolase n=1 Tax=Streptomyces beigongshangae TaxID=2841597 RepID=UPI001C848559|nr:alpha/beta hydrolase [Streptomyces sp. REN17]